MPQQTGEKIQVFLAARNQFGNSQVMNFQAESPACARVLVVNGDKTITPTIGQHSRPNTDTMGVITESPMKGRAFANGPVNQIAIRRIPQGKYVGLDGNQQFFGCLRELTEHSLAADNDKFRGASNGGSRPDDMLKLLSEHSGSGI